VVLVDPPAVAQPDQQVGVDDADAVVGPPRAEDLPVPGVMAGEAELGEDDPEEPGGEQLPPRLAEEEEDRPPGGEQEPVQPDLRGVVPRPAVEQARLPDPPGQLRVVAAPTGGRAPRRARWARVAWGRPRPGACGGERGHGCSCPPGHQGSNDPSGGALTR